MVELLLSKGAAVDVKAKNGGGPSDLRFVVLMQFLEVANVRQQGHEALAN